MAMLRSFLSVRYDAMGLGAVVRDKDAFRGQMEGMRKVLADPAALAAAMQGINGGLGGGVGGGLGGGFGSGLGGGLGGLGGEDPSAVDEFDPGDL